MLLIAPEYSYQLDKPLSNGHILRNHTIGFAQAYMRTYAKSSVSNVDSEPLLDYALRCEW